MATRHQSMTRIHRYNETFKTIERKRNYERKQLNKVSHELMEASEEIEEIDHQTSMM